MTTIGELHREAKVDKFHLYGGVPITAWQCGKCKDITKNTNVIKMEPTLGTWGPNGNGWNYWHCEPHNPPLEAACGGRMEPLTK